MYTSADAPQAAHGATIPRLKATVLQHADGVVSVLEECSVSLHGAAGPDCVEGALLTVSLVSDAPPYSSTLELPRGAAPSFGSDDSIVLTAGKAAATCTLVFKDGDNHSMALLRQQLAAATASAVVANAGNAFDSKTDAASAHMYFHYYGMLQHQQNMLQDCTRTGTYYWAIMANQGDFEDAVVVDVGAGTAILSLFAAQAGARKVYAIEASDMVQYARKLVQDNGAVGSRVEVVHGKLEGLSLPEPADVLISEPMGTLLVNERMLETYVYARKHMLKPGGLMFPALGRIFAAPFSDAALFAEVRGMASFWLNDSFYGVRLAGLHADSTDAYFAKVVIDTFDPGILVCSMASAAAHVIDFRTVETDELQDIRIPLAFTCQGPVLVHGVACWFDVQFAGSTQPMWLSTAPGMPITHWFQLRCVLQTPISVQSDGQLVRGELRLRAHAAQSYDVQLELESQGVPGDASSVQKAAGRFDLKDPYYRQLRPTWTQASSE